MNEIPAKKSLGQNFLNSPGAISKIVEAAEITEGEVILEIGPGKGALTEKLLEKAGKVVAVEKDDRLIPLLHEKFGRNPDFKLIHGDILLLWESKTLKEETGARYKVVANLPYYITGIFLEKLSSAENPPQMAILMLQREVADRILKRDGKESILSIAIAAYGSPSLVTHVPAGAFSPVPAVDSSVVKITNISKDFFIQNGLTEESFFEMIHRGFAHKRKLLANNLEIATESLQKCSLLPTARAEEVPLSKWACLAGELSTQSLKNKEK
ncbi:MAG: 16S rRNA (adenine(1518)-N(6)/adenine(1519)-N(6))-dimethyltransferase RsmA [Patescibacteria group bacterium]